MLTSLFPKGNALVPTATPAHVTQLVYQSLKYIFAGKEDTYPFKWQEDINLTGIVFDTVFNKEAEVYGKKPIVICSGGGMAMSQVSMGDLAVKHIPTGNSYKTTTANCSVIIKIISRTHAEVEILKNEIFGYLLVIRTILPSITNIHMVTAVAADETRKFVLDENMYAGILNLNYLLQYTWEHDIAQNLLAGMNVILNTTFGFTIPSVPLV